MGLGRRYGLGKFERLQSLRGGQELDAAALQRRPCVPPGGRAEDRVPPEAEVKGRGVGDRYRPGAFRAQRVRSVNVSADAVMTELQGRVRERLRLQMLQNGGSRAFEDPALFAEVEAMLQAAANTSE